MGNVDLKDSFFFFINIMEMPDALYQIIERIHPRYKKHFSKTVHDTYFANICECGANFGDYYLFTRPDGAFFPTSIEDASNIQYYPLKFTTPFFMDAGWSEGSGIYILVNGSQIISASDLGH